jgi:cytoskeletal protein RodZ
MGEHVNSSHFNKNNNKKNGDWKKRHPWVPLVVIVIIALLMILINYFMIDIMTAVR